MILVVDALFWLAFLSDVVGILLLVDCSLILAFHHLELRDDRGLVDRSLDSLVVVHQGPENSSCIGFDLGVLVVSAQEGEEARKEVVILEEVDLVLSAVQGRISDEEKNGANKLIEWAEAEVTLRDAWLRNCWDVDCIQQEESKLKCRFDFEDLSGTFIS